MTQTTPVDTADHAGISNSRASNDQPALGSNLAGLLDRFTRSVTGAASHTVGEFAATVEALHSELSMLAGSVQHRIHTAPQNAPDFDDIFPGDTNEPASYDPAYHGIAASEELEHACRQIARSR